MSGPAPTQVPTSTEAPPQVVSDLRQAPPAMVPPSPAPTVTTAPPSQSANVDLAGLLQVIRLDRENQREHNEAQRDNLDKLIAVNGAVTKSVSDLTDSVKKQEQRLTSVETEQENQSQRITSAENGLNEAQAHRLTLGKNQDTMKCWMSSTEKTLNNMETYLIMQGKRQVDCHSAPSVFSHSN